MAIEVSGQLEHPDDVYTNARKLRLCRQPGGEIGLGRLEHVGLIHLYGDFTGYGFGDGDQLYD